MPVLVSDKVFSQHADSAYPGATDRKHLAWTVRPMQHMLVGQEDGTFMVPKPPEKARIEALLSLHDYWSDTLWEEWDSVPGHFEDMLGKMEYRSAR